MKRLFALALAVLFALSGLSFAESDGLRYKITGDVSTLTASEEVDHAKEENVDSVSLHTNVYLFVDPDSASYITFTVVDEEGRPIEGAIIYITYNGYEQLFDVTDENGNASMYLFRGVEYDYRVEKEGYETAHGRFMATEELKNIKVVLRKFRIITIQGLKNWNPWPFATMFLNGERIFGDENGCAVLRRVNGQYLLELLLPNGRRIHKIITVKGDGWFQINYSEDDLIVPGATYADRFLVYTGKYSPKDYVYSEYLHTASDVKRLPGETDEEYAARVAEYLSTHPNEIIVNALPIDGEMRSRIMIPSGWLQRQWEQRGFEQVTFTNGSEGMRFQLADLYNPLVMRAFAVLYAMTDGKTLDFVNDPKAFSGSDLQSVMKQKFVFLNAEMLENVKDYAFPFANTNGLPTLPDDLFCNASFEYALTPINMDSFIAILREEDSAAAATGIVLGNDYMFKEKILDWYAQEDISPRTLNELARILADSLLSPDEAARVADMISQGQISAQALERLLSTLVENSVYRVSCRIHYNDVYLDVTELLQSLVVFWDADQLDNTQCFRAAFIRELFDQAGNPYIEQPSEQVAGESDVFQMTALENKIRELTILVNPSANYAQEWTAEPVDAEAYPQPKHILVGEAPFAGVNALFRVEE